MFVKKITKRDKVTKKQYVTYRLVHSYRLAGKPRHKNIVDLGTLSGISPEDHKALANRIEHLLRNGNELFKAEETIIETTAKQFYYKILKKYESSTAAYHSIFEVKENKREELSAGNIDEQDNYQEVNLNSFNTEESKTIGSEWLCVQAIKQIGLDETLIDDCGFNSKQLAEALQAITGRLVFPGSDNKTADYLNENSGAAYLLGQEDKPADRKKLSQISDLLYNNKDVIEKSLISRFRNLFNYKPSLLIYDLTNSHFEGQMLSSDKSTYGKNKQKRNDCPQITTALAIDEHGFLQKSRFYEGNISEPETLSELIEDITQNIPDYHRDFANIRPIVIIDAGIASEDNLKLIHSIGYHYMVVSRSEHTPVRKLIDENELTEIKNANEKSVYIKSYANSIKYKNKEKQDVEIKEQLLYVKTEEKKKKEDGILNGKKEKLEEELKHINKVIANGRKKYTPQEMYERIGRLKERYKKVQSCYTIKIAIDKESGRVSDLDWSYKQNNKKEQQSGSYFIRTSKQDINDEQIWNTYHQITQVEAIFRILKTDLKIRPIYHQYDIHIESHLFVCILSVQIALFVRKILNNNNIYHCWTEIIRIMNSQVYNINSIKRRDGANIIIRSCTRPGKKAQQIYNALKFKPVPFYRKITIVDN